MSLKDFLVKRIAQRMKQPEDVVDAVVMNQFKGILSAMQKYKSVEMTGFGKFLFLDKRALRMKKVLIDKLQELEKHSLSKEVSQKEIDSLRKDIEFLNNRTNAL